MRLKTGECALISGLVRSNAEDRLGRVTHLPLHRPPFSRLPGRFLRGSFVVDLKMTRPPTRFSAHGHEWASKPRHALSFVDLCGETKLDDPGLRPTRPAQPSIFTARWPIARGILRGCAEKRHERY
jgi:hypothetical protein